MLSAVPLPITHDLYTISNFLLKDYFRFSYWFVWFTLYFVFYYTAMCTRVVNHHRHVRSPTLLCRYIVDDTYHTCIILTIFNLFYSSTIINYKAIIDHFVRKIIINTHNIILFDVPRECEFVLLYQQHNNIVVFIFVFFFSRENEKEWNHHVYVLLLSIIDCCT